MSPWLAWILVFGLALVVLHLLRRTWQRWRRDRRSRSAAARGHALEKQAAKALTEHGFRVLAHHPEVESRWVLDGEAQAQTIRADYLATREGRSYIIEVKTGGGANPRQAGTRRQLLEYALYYRVDGVALYDAERDRLHIVEFPLAPRRGGWLAPLLIGFALGAAAWAAWLSAR